MTTVRNLRSILPLLFLSAGCVSLDHPMVGGCLSWESPPSKGSAEYRSHLEHLAEELLALDHTVGRESATAFAEAAIDCSAALAQSYNLVHPPVVHNLLVHFGFKDRGLCHHFAADLFAQLNGSDERPFDVHRAIAHRGSFVFCHASVVVTSRGGDFLDGIVLDPWRRSGVLFFGKVADDGYPWETY